MAALRTVFIVFLPFYACLNIAIAAGIGESCATEICDSTNKYLECDQTSKICLCKPGAQYDWNDPTEANQVCKLLVGQPCESPLQPFTVNSICDATTNFFVSCESGFIEINDGLKCGKPYNGACQMGQRHCNENAYQECIGSPGTDGYCRCNDASIFDGEKCVLKANQNCKTLPGKPDELPHQQCSILSQCKESDPDDQKCECNENLKPNVNGLCKVMHEGECDNSPQFPCDDGKFLTCINSKCSCRLGTVYEGGEENGACHIEANRDCTQGQQQECVEFSNCSPVSEGNGAGNHFCMCNPGSVENIFRQCVRPFGAVCGRGSDPPCDKAARQSCIRSECVCEAGAENSIYDPLTRTCYLRAGSACSEEETATPCMPNSECISKACYCMNGLQPSKDKTRCVMAYGDQCNINNSLCDTSTFQECNGTTSKCDCANKDATFDPVLKTCRLKVKAECDPSPGKQSCVDLAQCDEITSTCECRSSTFPRDEGLVGNQLGQCVRKYNATCDLTDIEGNCDTDYGFQTCQASKCVCSQPEDMSYNATDGRCYLLKDKACTEKIPCEAGLACEKGICSCDSSMGLVEDKDGECVRTPGSTCDDSDPLGRCNEKAYMSCIEQVCECNSGYNKTGEGIDAKCVGNYNLPCSGNENCNLNSSMVCNTIPKCDCASPVDQIYDIRTQRCWTRLHGRCHVSRNDVPAEQAVLECQPGLNMECRRQNSNDGGNYGECQCRANYLDVYGVCSGGSVLTGVTFMAVLISVIVHKFNLQLVSA